MASSRISPPMRGLTSQMSRCSIWRDAGVAKTLATSFARPISTSSSTKAAVSSITTSADSHVPVTPFDQQTVLATIHRFPSLEPLRFQQYPANHLYLPTRKDILHRAVVYEGDMTRSGTASTKTRYEVRGSARKIRPQKGTGHARLGDRKSPMLRGGGVAFGPKPRDFSTRLQKKVYDLAWRTALSYRFRKGELLIVDNSIEIESPSTRLLGDIFTTHDKEHSRGRSLFVTLEDRPLLRVALEKMGRERQVLTWEEVDVKDLLELSRIVIERDALRNILLSHQEDLTTHPKGHRSLIKTSRPSHLDSMTGWMEFRRLMLAPAEEREQLRPDAYESVAFRRYNEAQALPATDPKRLQLLVSCYDLLVEAKVLRRDLLQAIAPLKSEMETLTMEAENIPKSKPLTKLELQLRAKDIEVDIYDTQYQSALYHAQSFEHKTEALRLQGRKSEADDAYESARDARTDVANQEQSLYVTKHEREELDVQLCRLKKDVVGEERAIAEARVWADKAEQLRKENEEEVEGEFEEPAEGQQR